MKTRKYKIVDGVPYVLVNETNVRDSIIAIANKEWEPEDFTRYGTDLKESQWKLEIVSINKIKEQTHLMASKTFQADLKKRIVIQRKLYAKQTPLSPIVLRGSDYLIFDGYARIYFLKGLGIKHVLAYVGYKI